LAGLSLAGSGFGEPHQFRLLELSGRELLEFVLRDREQRKLLGADDQPCMGEALEQSPLDDFLRRPRVAEIEDIDLLVLLPNAIDAPNALLDLHRVPGQIVVDQ